MNDFENIQASKKQNQESLENNPFIENEQVLDRAISSFYEYLNVSDKPDNADVIFILGGSSLKPVEKAAELYKEGFASKVAFISTGGKFGGEKIWHKPENEKYKEELIKLGVPEENIIEQGLSSNTLEEAKSAVPFLKEHVLALKKMILVARPVHQRRAWATFLKQHPGIKYLNCPADEQFDLNDIEAIKRLVGEAQRLLDYAKKGDIEKQEIPLEILKAAARIRMSLKKNGQYEFRQKP